MREKSACKVKPRCGKQNNDKRTFTEWVCSRCLFHIASLTISISYCWRVVASAAAHWVVHCINITSGMKKTFQEQFLSGSEWCVFLTRLAWISEKIDCEKRKKKKLINYILNNCELSKRNWFFLLVNCQRKRTVFSVFSGRYFFFVICFLLRWFKIKWS